MPLKSVGSFTATADPGLGPGARVAIFIMRFLGFAGSEAARAGAGALGSEGAGAKGSGARVIATEGPATEAAAATGTGAMAAGLETAGALFFPNNPLTTVTTGSAELGFISNCSASNVGKLASASVAFLIGIFEKLFAFGFLGCSACGRGTSDI